MNKQEFDELRNEFAEYIYKYEYFLKCGYLNDLYYNRAFRAELDKNTHLEFENSVLYTAIKEHEKPEFDLAKLLEIAKNNKTQLENSVAMKQRNADLVCAITDKMPLADRKAFEEEYLATLKVYHPVIKVFVTEEEKNAFNTLRKYYNENNVNAFRETFMLNKEILNKQYDYKPEDYIKVSGFFYENQKRINADYAEKSKKYPYTKGDVLKDEITIARETGELHAMTTKLVRDNTNLKAQYKQIFGKDFEL